MPRPAPAQYLYGSATVVLSTLAMLLLSGASSGPGVVLVTFAGLALGLLVAVALGGTRYAEPDEGAEPAPGEPRAGRSATARSGPGRERELSGQSPRG